MRVLTNVSLAIISAACLSIGVAQAATHHGYGQYHGSAAAQGQHASGQANAHANFSAATLKKYAKARQAVTVIGHRANKEMQAVHNAKKMQKVRAASEKRMIQAVKKTGLSVKKYNEISKAAIHDAKLRGKIQKMAS